MDESGRFNVEVRGDVKVTNVALHIPTRWAWSICVIWLAVNAPDVWKLIQDVAQAWPFD